MGSSILQTPRLVQSLLPLIGGGITAVKSNPQDMQNIMSSMLGSPSTSTILRKFKEKDEDKIINFEEKKKLKKDSDPDPEDDGKDVMSSLQNLEDLRKEFDKFEKEKQTNRKKENTAKKIFQEILPKNVKTSARFDIMNKYGDFDFSTTDFMVFPENDLEGRFATKEEVSQIQKDFNALVNKITTLKKAGGMVDKAISYPPRN